MKGKKKLIISLSVAISVLLVAVIAIISISAALNQNISSNVKVNFKPSQHVIGHVSATYTYGNTTHSMTTNGMGNGNTTVKFAYNDKETTKTLLMRNKDLTNGKLFLSEDVKSVVYKFSFLNTGYSDFVAKLDLSSITTQNNMSLSYSYNGNMWFTEDLEIDVPASKGGSIPSPKECYIKIRVSNMALDADFEGTFIWELIAEEDYRN